MAIEYNSQKNGHNSIILGPTKKNTGFRLCAHAMYKILSSYQKPFSGFTSTLKRNAQMDRQTLPNQYKNGRQFLQNWFCSLLQKGLFYM